MKVRSSKKVVAGLVVSAAMAMGFTMAGTGTAAAASSYKGPELSVQQGVFGDKNLELSLTNPNDVEGLLGQSACTSVLLDGMKGLEAFAAFNNKDFGALLQIVRSQGVVVGPSAANRLLDPGPNRGVQTVQAGPGVYFFVGTCGGWDTAFDPSNVGVSLAPVIVPDGSDILAPVIDFGSAALAAGDELISVLPLLLQLASGSADAG